MKSQYVTASERVMAAEIPLAMPRKPAAQPRPRGIIILQYLGSACRGRVSTSINGR